MSRLIVMSGPAGAGKSTCAHKLLEENPHSVIISSDDIRDEVYGGRFPGVFDDQKEKELWRQFIEQTKEASKNYDVVILDSTCLTNKKRLKWYNIFRNYFTEFKLVIINRSLETCVAQDSKRSRHVPKKSIKEQIDIFQEPNDKIEGLFEIIRL